MEEGCGREGAAGWTGRPTEQGCWQNRVAGEAARLAEGDGRRDMAADGAGQSRLAGWGF